MIVPNNTYFKTFSPHASIKCTLEYNFQEQFMYKSAVPAAHEVAELLMAGNSTTVDIYTKLYNARFLLFIYVGKGKKYESPFYFLSVQFDTFYPHL